MKRTTHDGIVFEIPTELEGTLAAVSGSQDCYVCSDPSAKRIAISELVSPKRNPGVRWFDVDRMTRILEGFSSQSPIPPIEVHRNPETGELQLRNGFHRFYAAVAAEHSHVPCKEDPYF